MTQRQARIFFLVCTLGFAGVFLALTIDSHRQFGRLTHAENITPAVKAGKDVWHRKNCINCHTLLGEGAYYAPDLTAITKLRGAAYLKAFLQDPAQFYSEEKHRRVMPNPGLSSQEIDEVIAFLDWVSKIDTQGWPPRPILVSGGAFPGTAQVAVTEGEAGGVQAPAARGEAVFRDPQVGCFACHSTAPGVNLAGPSLAGIATRAAAMPGRAGYTGHATDAEGYVRESILAPGAYLVPGPTYSAGGASIMPGNFEERLTPDQVNLLVAFLLTLT